MLLVQPQKNLCTMTIGTCACMLQIRTCEAREAESQLACVKQSSLLRAVLTPPADFAVVLIFVGICEQSLKALHVLELGQYLLAFLP